MVPRPASPTSLLWAHQLRLEHVSLLDRVKSLEASHQRLDARVTECEAGKAALNGALSTSKDIALRLSAVEQSNSDAKNAIERLESDNISRQTDKDTKLQELARKVGTLERDGLKRDADGHETILSYQAIVSRLDKIEAAWTKEKKEKEKLTRKDDPQDIKVLTRRLDALESQLGRNDDGLRNKVTLDRILALEGENQRLNALCLQLSDEVVWLNDQRRHTHRMHKQHVPVPPSEASTLSEPIETLMDSSPRLQVPRSPVIQSSASFVKQYTIEESPVQGAQLRRSIKAISRLAGPIGTPTLAQQAQKTEPTGRNKMPPPERSLDPANSRKKRKAASTFDVRQTRSQAKSKALQQQQESAQNTRPAPGREIRSSKRQRVEEPSRPNAIISKPQEHIPKRRMISLGDDFPEAP